MAVVKDDPQVGDPQCQALTERGLRCRRGGLYDVEVGGRLALLCAAHRKQARREPDDLVLVDDGTGEAMPARARGDG